jgi:hypothetical protein
MSHPIHCHPVISTKIMNVFDESYGGRSLCWNLGHLNARTSYTAHSPAPKLTLTYPNLLFPWSRDLLENLTITQLVKKFSAFYGTRRFIALFTTAATGPYSESYPSIPHPISLISTPILSSHLRLGLPSGLFPPGAHFFAFLISPIRATCQAHLILDLITY